MNSGTTSRTDEEEGYIYIVGKDSTSAVSYDRTDTSGRKRDVLIVDSTADGIVNFNQVVGDYIEELPMPPLPWQPDPQWVLKDFPMRIDPPQLMPITEAVRYLKMPRCNRKGMGLRIRRDN